MPTRRRRLAAIAVVPTAAMLTAGVTKRTVVG